MTTTAKQRVEQECADLAERIEKLKAFMPAEKFRALPIEQQGLLSAQFGVMTAYEQILRARLLTWSDG